MEVFICSQQDSEHVLFRETMLGAYTRAYQNCAKFHMQHLLVCKSLNLRIRQNSIVVTPKVLCSKCTIYWTIHGKCICTLYLENLFCRIAGISALG